jgi:hypothetical protein
MNHHLELHQGSRLFSKVGGDENSAESLKIFAESVSNSFPEETEQRTLNNSSTAGGILFIKIDLFNFLSEKNTE